MAKRAWLARVPSRSTKHALLRLSLLASFATDSSCVTPPPDENTGTTSQPIIGGTSSDASQDAVVLVLHFIPEAQRWALCSGTMLTPRLVLTARHCVAAADPSMACSASGRAVVGGRVEKNFPATDLYVYAGRERPSLNEILPKAVRGLEVIDDGSKALCNQDIGLLLLEAPVPDARIAPVRLSGKARIGEPVTFVGWGSTNGSSLPFARQQRKDGSVVGVGPSRSLSLGSAELMVGEGVCEGDSGSPALSAKGAVIGTLSRGGNGKTTADGTSSCLDGRNIYTAPSGFKSLLLNAYARAGQEPWVEGRANPMLSKDGAACTQNSECRSNDCDPDQGICRENCAFAGCDEGFVCGEPERKQCVPAPPSSSGGCATGGSAGTTEFVVGGVVLLALLLRRRFRDRGSLASL